MRTVIVSGPPCAGKSTYVHEHRSDGDVVIDFDQLAHTLGYPTEHVAWPPDGHPARAVALRARASAIKAALENTDPDVTLWLIQGTPPDGGYWSLAGHERPVESVHLDPGMATCLTRAEERPDPEATRAQIVDWYAFHDATGSRSW